VEESPDSIRQGALRILIRGFCVEKHRIWKVPQKKTAGVLKTPR